MHRHPQRILIAIIFWSVARWATVAHTVFGFGVLAFLSRSWRSGKLSAAIKTSLNGFPKKERALATGIFNSGTNIGALVTPLVVPIITIRYGWRAAFIVTGAIGFIWLFAWWALYRRPEEHPSLSKSELEYIQSDPPDPIVKVPWARLLPHRQTWAFSSRSS
jgi:ACS family hexuronate transporter-like MFS transporter